MKDDLFLKGFSGTPVAGRTKTGQCDIVPTMRSAKKPSPMKAPITKKKK